MYTFEYGIFHTGARVKRFFILKTTITIVAWAIAMSSGTSTSQAAVPITSTDRTIVLVFGDSISAAYGLRPEQGWVAMLADKLKREGFSAQVVNASISGETTAGGLARLPRALALHHPSIVVFELGANDGLRALPVEEMRQHLNQLVDLAVGAGAKVLLLGMRMPPNYGPQYTEQFHAAYADLAQKRHVAWVPFFLEGVALRPELIQEDGLHPNAQGEPILLENIWPVLKPLLSKGPDRTLAPKPLSQK